MAYCTLHYDDVPPVLFDGAQVRFEGRVYLPDGKSGEPHMDFALWMRQSGQSFGIAAYQGIAVLNGEAGPRPSGTRPIACASPSSARWSVSWARKRAWPWRCCWASATG